MKVKGKRLESTKLGVSGRSYPWIYPGILRQSFPLIEGIFFLNLSYWISYWMNFWIILRYLQFIPFLKAQFLELWVPFFLEGFAKVTKFKLHSDWALKANREFFECSPEVRTKWSDLSPTWFESTGISPTTLYQQTIFQGFPLIFQMPGRMRCRKGWLIGVRMLFFHWAVWKNNCNKARELYCFSLGYSTKRIMGDWCWLSVRTRSPKRESLPNHTTNESFKIRCCFVGNPSRLRWKRSGPFFSGKFRPFPSPNPVLFKQTLLSP